MKYASFLVVAGLAGLLSACGDNLPLEPDAGPPTGVACTPLSLGRADFRFDLFGRVLGLAYPIDTALGGPAPEQLFVELYDSSTGGLPPLATGVYDLSEAPDDNLRTCQHCLWIPLDWDGNGPVTRVLWATKGTLTLTAVTDPLEVTFAGTASDVVLREATVDAEGDIHRVNGGECARVDALAIDTRPTPGQTCLSAEDCGNPLLEVCSPATNTCGHPECGEELGCPAERPTCMIQYGDLQLGACYAQCNPQAVGGCGAGQACVQLGLDASVGICKQTGAGALGSACTWQDNSTSCAPGIQCSRDGGFCTNTCDFFAAAPGCQDGAQCSMFNVCEGASYGSAAAIGAPCEDDAELAIGCGRDGEAYRGMCFSYSPVEAMTCSKACRDGEGCSAAEFCAIRFDSGLGICLPDPVCGDGLLGEIDEICDDGNTASGDGCSADCQTVEYGPLCAAAIAIAPNGMVEGDTSVGWDGIKATCQLGRARADVYTFTPPGHGRLRLTVASETQHVISIRGACADAGSERGCAANDNLASDQLVYQVTDGAPITVIVSAFTVIEEGPYTLHAEWVDETCGDGQVAGAEICDDGNTASGDGCRADCRAFEWDALCALATPLVAGTTTMGDLTGAPLLFDSTCANTIYGGGPDKLYRYTATAAGTLRIAITDSSDLIAYAVLDGCGVPGSFGERACQASFFPEPIEVAVTAGQVVTVQVEAYSAWQRGTTFTLSTELLP